MLVLCTAAVSADPPVHLQLTFAADSPIAAAIRDDAVREAGRVWEPYGIVVETADTTVCTAHHPTLAVAVDLKSDNERDNGLGAVRFAADGVPDSEVRLHYGAIVDLVMSATAMGWQGERWPTALRDQIIARALGRALAHEIGHVVLRWPHHPASGLMRSEFSASALADPDRSAFALTAVDEARLHVALSALLQAGCAVL